MVLEPQWLCRLFPSMRLSFEKGRLEKNLPLWHKNIHCFGEEIP
tara:strand:- start:2095 stop:2226 length:132 start_codon:yes stop_codon:yes gene_type:complete